VVAVTTSWLLAQGRRKGCGLWVGRTEVAGSKGHFDWLAAMNKIWTSHWAGKGQWAEIGRGRENQFWNWFSKYNDFRNSNQGDFEVKKNLEKFQKSSRFLLVF
jgi:hypothetical protein